MHPTLSGLAARVEAARPQVPLPAFLPHSRLAALAAAFPDMRIVSENRKFIW